VRPDGRSVGLLTRGLYLRAGIGESPRLTGITADITERKQREEDFRSTAARVATAVASPDWDHEMGTDFHVHVSTIKRAR